MKKPEIKSAINLSEVGEACQDYIDFLDSPEYHVDKLENYEREILEKTLEAVFGKDVWDFVNRDIEITGGN